MPRHFLPKKVSAPSFLSSEKVFASFFSPVELLAPPTQIPLIYADNFCTLSKAFCRKK